MSSLSCLCVGLFSSAPTKDYTFYIDSHFNFMFKLLLLDGMIWANTNTHTHANIYTSNINVSNDWLKINYKTYLEWMAANGICYLKRTKFPIPFLPFIGACAKIIIFEAKISKWNAQTHQTIALVTTRITSFLLCVRVVSVGPMKTNPSLSCLKRCWSHCGAKLFSQKRFLILISILVCNWFEHMEFSANVRIIMPLLSPRHRRTTKNTDDER